MNLMDYSLLVGIHDTDQAAADEAAAAENQADNQSDNSDEALNGVAGEGDEESAPLGGASGGIPPGTPPDSPMYAMPQPSFEGELDSQLEQFAFKCDDSKFEYFLSYSLYQILKDMLRKL